MQPEILNTKSEILNNTKGLMLKVQNGCAVLFEFGILDLPGV